MKKIMLITIMLGLFLVSGAIAQEPGDTLWTSTCGGSGDDRGHSVQKTSDGGYIIAGYTGAFPDRYLYLIKTDSLGDTIWTKTYGGPDRDWATSVDTTTDGGYIIAGICDYGGMPLTVSDAWLVKTDSFGDTIWTKNYGDPGEKESANSVDRTTDGGYILAGEHTYGSFPLLYADMYVVKTDSLGDTLWTKNYGGDDNDCAYSIRQTSDGGYVIAGSYGYSDATSDFYLIKTDSLGDTLWTKTYGGSGRESAYSLDQTTDGGYILAGTNTYGTPPDFTSDIYVVKTDSLGDTLWTKTYGGTDSDEAYSIEQTSDGGYIIAGYTGADPDYDVYLIKTNALGDTIWTRTYGGIDDDKGYSVQQTLDNSYIIAGYTGSWPDYDVYLLKVAGEPQPVTVTVSGVSIAPSGVSPGDTEVGMLKLSFVTDSGEATWTDVKVDLTGTAVDSDISSVEIWKDDGDGIWEGTGQDTEIGSGTFSAITVTIDIIDQTINPSSQDFFVVYDIADGADPSHTAGTRLADNSYITVASPDVVSSANFPIESGIVTLPVELAAFTATYFAENGYTSIYWATASETDVNGFNIYRNTEDVFGTAMRINADLIPGYGTTSEPKEYTFIDDNPVVFDIIYYYWLESIDLGGETHVYASISITPEEGEGGFVNDFDKNMLANYPNPFSCSTTIEYGIKGRLKAEPVEIRIYNVAGQLVETIEARYGTAKWNVDNLPTGVYFYQLKTENYNEVKKMVVIR